MKATEKLENIRKHMGDEFMEEAFGEGSPASPCSLLDCVCGGSPEVGWDSCMDWGGRSWQTVSVICKECMRSTEISIDADNDQEREAATRLIEPHWNAFITANAQE